MLTSEEKKSVLAFQLGGHPGAQKVVQQQEGPEEA
jgi:hypothetical protein